MEGKSHCESLLVRRGVRPTANRLLVARALHAAEGPLSLAALEGVLDTMDRSSIFRALRLFERAAVVHAIDDGSGSVKYELCHGGDSCSPADMHAHFHCEGCGRTLCLEGSAVPFVHLPAGFAATGVTLLVKGLCDHCSRRR